MFPLLLQYSAYVLLPLVALALAWFLTFACIRIMPLLGVVAQPGGRHIHATPTPKGGGLAVAIAFFTAWGLLLVSPWSHFPGVMNADLFLRIAPPAAALVAFGLADDRFDLRARYKLLVQVLLAAYCWHAGIRLEAILSFTLPAPLSLLATIAWIVGFINAFNLIDGMDGVAAGLAVMTSLCMAAVLALRHAPLDMVVVLCLGAACLGFLRYNFHPARIFLGDTGSMLIGFVFGIVGITAASRSTSISAVLIPLLAAGVPFFDVVLAIWRRYTRGILARIRSPRDKAPGIMDADADHLHHRILTREGNYRRSTLILYAMSVACAIVAIGMQLIGDREAGLALLILVLVAIAVVRRIASVELWTSTMLVAEGIARPRRGVLASLAHPALDLTILILCFIATEFIFSTHGLPEVIRESYDELIYCILPIVALLLLGGIYRRCWVRACGREYIYLVELLLLGNLAAAIIRYHLIAPPGLKIFLAFHAFFFLATSALILAERVGLRVLRNSVIKRNLYLRRFGASHLPNVLIYGGGQLCYFYLHNHHRNIESTPLHVVGIMDDHPVLNGQYVYGYKVLGGLHLLAEIHAEHHLDQIVLTCQPDSPQKTHAIHAFCQRNNIALARFACEETPVPTTSATP